MPTPALLAIALLGGPITAGDIGVNIDTVALAARCDGGELAPELVGYRTPPARQRIPMPTDPTASSNNFGKRQLNSERALAHLSADVLVPLKQLGKALMTSNAIDPVLREMIIVRVSYLSRSAYEVRQHASLAIASGASRDAITGLACARPQVNGDARRSALAFTDALVRDVRVDDAVLADARAHFNDRQILQIVTVVGEWMMAARLLETINPAPDDFVAGGAAAATGNENATTPQAARGTRDRISN